MNTTHLSQVLLTEKQACSYMGVSRSTLVRYRLSGAMPWIDLGRGQRCLIRFLKSDLDRFIEQKRMAPLEVKNV